MQVLARQATGVPRSSVPRMRSAITAPGGAQDLVGELGLAGQHLVQARAAQRPHDARRDRVDLRHAHRLAEQRRLADDGAGAQQRDLGRRRGRAAHVDLQRARLQEVHRAVGIALVDQDVAALHVAPDQVRAHHAPVFRRKARPERVVRVQRVDGLDQICNIHHSGILTDGARTSRRVVASHRACGQAFDTNCHVLAGRAARQSATSVGAGAPSVASAGRCDTLEQPPRRRQRRRALTSSVAASLVLGMARRSRLYLPMQNRPKISRACRQPCVSTGRCGQARAALTCRCRTARRSRPAGRRP